MLKKLGTQAESKLPADEITIGEAVYPAVFPHTLEFNPPAHGTWNIVHIGMQMPEAHQIYVCGINCMRGVVLTAAEMGASDRFSCVVLHEKDVLLGTVEDITIHGTLDVIEKLPKRPPVVMLFTVCVHHFLGCDMDYIYRKLSEACPDITFLRCLMDPIMQKEGPTPDQNLRKRMYDVLEDSDSSGSLPGTSLSDTLDSGKTSTGSGKTGTASIKEKLPSISLLGSNVLLEEGNDLARVLEGKATLKEMNSCQTYKEFCRLGEADLFLSTVPNGQAAAEKAAERLGKKHLHLPMSFDYEEIERGLEALLKAVDSVKKEKLIKDNTPAMEHAPAEISPSRNLLSFFEKEKTLTEKRYQDLHKVIGNTPIYIDYTMHPRPLGLARFLLEHGFQVERVYLNAASREEADAFYWLKEHAPALKLIGTINPRARVRAREGQADGKILALGQQAAWFGGSNHFVNMVEGGGLFGFAGIRRMADLMEEAFRAEKDMKYLIPRKGLGCESCI